MPFVSEEGLLERRVSPTRSRVLGARREAAIRSAIQAELAKDTDEALAWLTAWRWPGGVECPQCRCDRFYTISSRRARGQTYRRCKRCRQDYSWSSGTLLSHGKASPQVYVAAIQAVQSNMVSAHFFAAVAGIQSSAASKLFWKIRCMETET